MNGSGLIYAAIVGAWAAYLVPMWLRRQDELNEARPTERFTTAIRILSRRSAFERRSARALAEKSGTEGAERRAAGESGRGRRPSGTAGAGPGAGAQASGAQGSGAQASAGQSSDGQSSVPQQATGSGAGSAAAAKGKGGGAGKRPAVPVRRDEGRAALLTRRRRVIASLFAGFTAGAILAGVAGLAWVWLPAVPGVLLSAYIVHLRVQERRRYEAGLRRLGRPAGKPGTPADAGAANEARVRARTREAADGATADPRPATPPTAGDGRQVRTPRSGPGAPGASGAAGAGGSARGRRERAAEEPALAEWIAELATGDGPDRDAWDPVPVPLPTYVTAPVVPRGDTEQEPERPQIHAVPDPQPAEALRPPTPLFDQYAEDTRTGYGASVDSLPLYEHEWRRAGNE
ncbi:gephyrin-like molybdotransferase receptor GlpR [Embleya sp. NPDC020630]|uniref:divisome protein SepX/GlpR n=1 Tax=Embleya sp. NPDC020630 TaxID=3363979 RepID=UPI0037AE893B